MSTVRGESRVSATDEGRYQRGVSLHADTRPHGGRLIRSQAGRGWRIRCQQCARSGMAHVYDITRLEPRIKREREIESNRDGRPRRGCGFLRTSQT
eukprot:4666736-Prymnesium_polylepis.2